MFPSINIMGEEKSLDEVVNNFYMNIMDVNGLREKTYKTELYCEDRKECITMELVGSHFIERILLSDDTSKVIYRLKFEVYNEVVTMIIEIVYNKNRYNIYYMLKDEDNNDEYVVIN